MKDKQYIHVTFKEDDNGKIIPIITGINFEMKMDDIDKFNEAISNVVGVLETIKIK